MRAFRKEDGTKIYLAVIGMLIGVNLLAAIVISAVKAANGKNLGESAAFNYAVMTAFQFVNIMVVATYLRKRGTAIESIRKPGLWAVPLSVAAGAVCIFGFFGLAYAFDMLLNAIGFTGTTDIPFDSAGQIAFGVLVTVVFAPVGEELVYRGALFSSLEKAARPWAAVLLSGLAFSLMHMNPQQTVYQFALGCACAYLVLKGGSVFCAVAAHAASNLVAVLMTVVPSFETGFDRFIASISPSPGVTAVWIVLSAMLAAAALFGIGILLRKRAPAPKAVAYERDSLPPADLAATRGWIAPYALALALCAVMWIAVLVQGLGA